MCSDRLLGSPRDSPRNVALFDELRRVGFIVSPVAETLFCLVG